MSLDLTSTALEIDQIALGLKARRDQWQVRVNSAMGAIASFDVAAYEDKRLQSMGKMAWSVPLSQGAPGARHDPPPPPEDFCVVAVDGSHIDVDRNMPVRCFLVNVGTVVITYGSRPDAQLYSEPRLFSEDDDLVIRDRSVAYREQAVEGAVLGARRTVEEIRALVKAVQQLPTSMPTLALLDGSLIMLGLIGHGFRDFVLRELIEEGFVPALDELERMVASRPLALASYISMPRAADVVNGLRLSVCPYEIANCGQFCSDKAPGQKPCDSHATGILDRDVFSEILGPGQRSSVFGSSSPLVESHYGGHAVSFFYIHAGEEIARIEVPSWVAGDETLLGLVHSMALDQCRRGPGYPIALMEAHEQAAVTGPDRRMFAELIDNALAGQRLPYDSSQKSRSKRLRWL